MNSDNQLLTIDEVSFILNVSTQTVRKLIKNHKLCAIKFGRIYRITWKALNEFIIERQGGHY